MENMTSSSQEMEIFKVPFSCIVRKHQNTAMLSFQPRMGNPFKWSPSGSSKGGGLCTVEMTWLAGRRSPECS